MPTVTGHAFVPNQFSYFQALVSACRTKNPTKALEVRYIYTCMRIERRNAMQDSYSGQCSVTEYFVVQYVVQCSIVQDSAHCTFRFLILIIISFDHSPCYSSPLSFAHPCRTSPFHASFHTIPLRCVAFHQILRMKTSVGILPSTSSIAQVSCSFDYTPSANVFLIIFQPFTSSRLKMFNVELV